MTPRIPTARRATRRATRRLNALMNKENHQTRRPDAPTAPVCVYSLHRSAVPCVRSSHVTGGRARVGPSGARSRAGLRPSGRSSGRVSGVGYAFVRARLLSLLPACEKKEGVSHEKAPSPASRFVTKPLRTAMPATAAFIDAIRDAFGADMINAAIRAGLDGQATFWARENGQEVGTRSADQPERTISLADIHLGPMNPANAKQPKGHR